MTPERRRLAALAIIPALVIGLAACAGAEPDAMPTVTPTPTPSVIETVAAPTPPGSRVPIDCAQLFAGLDGFVVTAAAEREDAGWGEAVLAQAGTISCQIDGTLGSTEVSTFAMVAADVRREMVQQQAVLVASPLTNLGGEISFSNCRAQGGMGYCLGSVWSGGYMVDYSIGPEQGNPAADFDQAFPRFAAALGSRVDSWAPPPAAWRAPDGALAWANECQGDVASTDAAVRAAMPFPVGAPSSSGGDGFWLWYEAQQRVGVTSCSWGGPEGNVSVLIVPGAAWYFERPGALSGNPYDFPGATATVTTSDSRDSLQVVVDDSYVEVSIYSPSNALDAAERIAAARAVADAIVSEFGTP